MASTRQTYAKTLRVLVDELGGDHRLANVTRDDLEQLLQARWEHVAPATWNRHVAVLGSFFTYCVEREWLIASPAHKLERRKPRRTPEQERQDQVISHAERDRLFTLRSASLRDRLLWRMLYDTAARADDILGLDVEDLERRINQAVVRGKGGSAERVYWTSETARLNHPSADRRNYLAVVRVTRAYDRDPLHSRAGGTRPYLPRDHLTIRRFPKLAAIIRSLGDSSMIYIGASPKEVPALRDDAIHDHDDLLDALERRDADAAPEAVVDHLSQALKRAEAPSTGEDRN